MARALFMGSAPVKGRKLHGLTERQIKLGCAQPGETVAIFGDALRRLTDRGTYVYIDGKRNWYATQPSVARLAQDRAAQQAREARYDERSTDAPPRAEPATEISAGAPPSRPVPPPGSPRGPEISRQRRFYGKVTLNNLRIGRDASAIADEIVAHLTKLAGAEVEVTLEIHATIPDGVSDATVRTVLENARVLHFANGEYGFEEE